MRNLNVSLQTKTKTKTSIPDFFIWSFLSIFFLCLLFSCGNEVEPDERPISTAVKVSVRTISPVNKDFCDSATVIIVVPGATKGNFGVYTKEITAFNPKNPASDQFSFSIPPDSIFSTSNKPEYFPDSVAYNVSSSLVAHSFTNYSKADIEYSDDPADADDNDNFHFNSCQ